MRIPLIFAVSAVVFLSGYSCSALPEDASPGAPVNAVDQAPATAAAKDPVFTQEQLDQMLAPIALYPDPLLAQVLMASTYPGEVTEAAAWSKAHPDAKGDDAVKQVASQTWDPSVQALVAFPQVLATLGQDPVWVQRLGDAFLAQPDDLMDGVQRLRHQAQAAGNLQSNQYQNVTVQNIAAPAPAPAAPAPAPASSSTVIIQPADPQVVYVPTYNPTTTYGTWAYPASPPVYYPPPPAYYPGSALMAGLAFGTGVAVVASLWGNCDWGNNDVDIDVNRYNNINGNNRITNNQSTLVVRKVLIACGAHSAKLTASLTGKKVPLDTERGYHLMLPNEHERLPFAVTSLERKFIMTPMTDGLRLAGTVEFAGLESPPSMERAWQLHRLSKGLFKRDLNIDAATPWMGFRPSLPDSLPIIDTVCDGKVLLAFGHQHLGLTQAAVTAELIGRMVLPGSVGEGDGLPGVEAYRLGRF
jgi:hypothetical protein